MKKEVEKLEISRNMSKSIRIYALKNPTTDVVFYVGRTSMTLASRLSMHIYSINQSKSLKADAIRELLKQKLKPEIIELAVIENPTDIETMQAEQKWINFYKSNSLTNAIRSSVTKTQIEELASSSICLKCNSTNISKSGIRRGKPAFICKDCKYQFVENALAVGKPKLEPCPPCPHCGNESRKLGKDRKGRQRYQCINCKATDAQACRIFTLENYSLH